MFRKLIHRVSNKREGIAKNHPLRKKTDELREMTTRMREHNQKNERNT